MKNDKNFMFAKIIHKLIHLWDEYDKAKKYFAEPKLKFYFGSWSKYGGLPVWRHGPIIYIGKHFQYKDACGGPWYGNWANHQVWDENFLTSCSSFGKWWRSFIKPVYQLPDWCAFYYSNRDIVWKTKYDDVRYEFSGQFCVVAFNICFAMWLTAPLSHIDNVRSTGTKVYPDDDSYWETILKFNYSDKAKSEEDRLSNAINDAGVYSSSIESTYVKVERDKLFAEAREYQYNSPEYNKVWKKIHSLKVLNQSWLACRKEYLHGRGLEIWETINEECKNSKKYIKNNWIE